MTYFGLQSEFLNKYLEYAYVPVGGSPQHHLGSILAVMSAVANKRCYYEHSLGVTIYTNLWICNVGSSGTRKSTAANIAKNVLLRHGATSALMIPENATPEAFVNKLSENGGAGLLFWDEFRTVLDRWKQSYMTGWDSLLTSLYDGADIEKLRVKKEPQKPSAILLEDNITAVINPRISVLTNTTPVWITSFAGGKMADGGTAQRFSYFMEDENPQMNWRGMRRPDSEKKYFADILLKAAETPFDRPKKLTMPNNSMELFVRFAEGVKEGDNDRITYFQRRVKTAALKIATLLAFIDGKTRIEQQYMQDAIIVANMLLKVLPHIVILTDDFFDGHRKSIIKVLDNYEKMSDTELLCMVNLDARHFDRAIETLIRMKKIKAEFREGTNEKWYTATM